MWHRDPKLKDFENVTQFTWYFPRSSHLKSTITTYNIWNDILQVINHLIHVFFTNSYEVSIITTSTWEYFQGQRRQQADPKSPSKRSPFTSHYPKGPLPIITKLKYIQEKWEYEKSYAKAKCVLWGDHGWVQAVILDEWLSLGLWGPSVRAAFCLWRILWQSRTFQVFKWIAIVSERVTKAYYQA